ncbi:hypothetical protein Tco_0418814 [Tanacetum coccineum]
MFKVFNRCLTTRISGHDQTKKNILQLFHAVINQTNVDYAALLWWDIMNNVRQKKEAIQYPRFIKLILADLMKKFPEIPQRIEEDYHSIKDDIPLVSVYTTGDVRIRGMMISDAFLTEEIRATDEFKEYETVFMNVDVLINQPKPVGSTQGMHRSTPRAHRTPTLTASPQGKKRNDDKERDEIAEATLLSLTLHKTALAAEAQENIAKVQEKLVEDEIEKMVEGEEDEESLEPRSHKENPEKVDDDDVEIEKEKKDDIKIEKEKKDDIEIEKEKKDGEIEKEKNNDNVEETDKVVKKDIFDDVKGNMEIRKEQKQTPIPSPTRSPRNVSSSDKTVSEELTATIREVLNHCNKVVHGTTFAKPKEMITQEMPRLVNLAVNKDRENATLNLYLTISTSTAEKSSADLQHQLHLNMKSKPQDQVAIQKYGKF